ncbi:MAG TPA: nucleotidyl transferase AbiEii/AbiGii toxin family protein [Solirubrobacteraceae bacterium]
MSLPVALRRIIGADTAEAWELVAPAVPAGCKLAGGTALAVHLEHRQSRDLDFFFNNASLDLGSVERDLAAQGEIAVTLRAAGTLNCQVAGAKVQFLHAEGQRDLGEALSVAGISVLSLADVFATKVKVVGDRGELRDYFDLKKIEQLTGRGVEEGIGLYMARFGVGPRDGSIPHILQSLGYLDDVDEDEMLPESKAEIEAYWRRRQPEVLRNLSRHGGG